MPPEDFDALIAKLAAGTADAADLEALRLALTTPGLSALQLGKYNINISQGQNVQIGDSLYFPALNDEAMQAIAQHIVQKLQASPQSAPSPAKSVDELVQQVRSRLHDDIQRLHGTMPLWGVDHWVPLGELFVDVYILEELSSSRRSELADLWQDFSKNPNNRSLDRIGLGEERQRVSGLEVLAKRTNLMVVGKPGSGKTTYLQRVVTECNAGNLQANKIPVLIRLREFVEDGRDVAYSLEQYLEQCWQLSTAETQLVLNQGRSLVLLDGLDEVTGEDGKTITKQIKQFARAYPQVQMVLTCRTQSQESRFERFDYVEVADFNEPQVRAFAEHWFQTVCADRVAGQAKAQVFLRQLFQEENKAIRELTITPILLSLTCTVFQQKQAFYSKRSKLYEEGLELLLKQWDRSREIERDEIYRDLSLERKLELLNYVAVKKFEQEQYVLFEQAELEGYIAEFLGIGLRESQTVLQAIESQHGLLIERSHEIWSFSHLTFQEYFVAKYFTNRYLDNTLQNQRLEQLITHLTEKSWKEVFLLTIELLKDATFLVLLMKEKTDCLLDKDEKIQHFLSWLNKKAVSVRSSYTLPSLRAFYFVLDSANAEIFDRTLPDRLQASLFLDFDLVRSLTPSDGVNLDFDLAKYLDKKLASSIGIVHGHGHGHYDEMGIPRVDAIADIIKRSRNSYFTRPIAPEGSLEFAMLFAADIILPDELYNTLQDLKDEVLDSTKEIVEIYSQYMQSITIEVQASDSPEQSILFVRDGWLDRKLSKRLLEKLNRMSLSWWKSNGMSWRRRLREIILKHRFLGNDWMFCESQKKKLSEYYYANKLIILCLHSGCEAVSYAVREIEETLLLPIAEIEKRKCENVK